MQLEDIIAAVDAGSMSLEEGAARLDLAALECRKTFASIPILDENGEETGETKRILVGYSFVGTNLRVSYTFRSRTYNVRRTVPRPLRLRWDALTTKEQERQRKLSPTIETSTGAMTPTEFKGRFPLLAERVEECMMESALRG